MNDRIRTLHKASLYAVVGVAFLALVPDPRIGPVTIGLFAGTAAASWYVDAAGWTTREHVPWWNAFVLLCLGLAVLQVAFTPTSPLIAGIRFILALTVVRLMSRHRVRDELQLYALAFLIMAAATAINEDLTYGFAFAGFVLTGTFSLALFHLERELDGETRRARLDAAPFDRRYVGVLAAMSVAIFAASLVFFIGFPRIGLGFFQSSSRDGIQITGFSDSVRLGTHGRLRESGEVAIRARFPEGRPADYQSLHWRTISFDHWDGERWNRTLEGDHPARRSGNRYDVSGRQGREMPDDASREIPKRIRLYVEPLGTDVLPTLWPTTSVEFDLSEANAPPGSPRSGEIEIDRYGDLTHTVPSDIGIPYTIETRPRPDPETLRQLDPDMQAARASLVPFLQLPESMEQIGDLARRLTRDAETPYERAEALEQFFRREFTYTTDLPDYDADAPVRDFLFDERRGHCEYYATAMALMLRTLDIPARIVNGFLGGKWNPVGGYLTVRQMDAHSWVEFYLPNYGWIPMDPTPVATIQGNRTDLFDRVGQAYDALRVTWYRWVLEYDLDRQIRMLRRLGSWLRARGTESESPRPETDEAESGSDSPWRSRLPWLGLIVLAALAAWRGRRHGAAGDRRRLVFVAAACSAAATGWFALFRGWSAGAALGGTAAGLGGTVLGVVAAWIGRRRDGREPTRQFDRIADAAVRAGLERRAGEPPSSLLERVAEAHPELRDDLLAFRRHYLAERFGPARPDSDPGPSLAERADRIVDRLDS